MKATGIVRRIDDLCRVVIPKEIRRTLHIREGDPLEIYTEKDGEVIFKKYSPMGDLSEFAAQICDSIGKNTGHAAAITDRDAIIALSGAVREWMAPGGYFLCSGIIDDRAAEVRAKLEENGLAILEENSSEGWFSYLCQ